MIECFSLYIQIQMFPVLRMICVWICENILFSSPFLSTIHYSRLFAHIFFAHFQGPFPSDVVVAIVISCHMLICHQEADAKIRPQLWPNSSACCDIYIYIYIYIYICYSLCMCVFF